MPNKWSFLAIKGFLEYLGDFVFYTYKGGEQFDQFLLAWEGI